MDETIEYVFRKCKSARTFWAWFHAEPIVLFTALRMRIGSLVGETLIVTKVANLCGTIWLTAIGFLCKKLCITTFNEKSQPLGILELVVLVIVKLGIFHWKVDSFPVRVQDHVSAFLVLLWQECHGILFFMLLFAW